MTLRDLVKRHGIVQAKLTEILGISTASMSLLLRGDFSLKRKPDVLKNLVAELVARGVPEAEIREVLNSGTAVEQTYNQEEEAVMILKRQSLNPQARQAFGILRDPFDDPQKPEHVFLTPQSRYAREALRDAAVNGNFLALVAESGAGKSTLKAELLEYLKENETDVVVIEPYVLTMSLKNDGSGKPLKTSHIIEAILHRLAPGSKSGGSAEAKAQRVHAALTLSAESGNRHVLIIEEAHDLHPQTLKALKRFWELKSGMKRLVSIILIGQNELADRLSSARLDVREVVQRCDVVTLPPLQDVGEFIRHRFASAGLDADKVFTQDAFDELRQRLIVGQDRQGKGVDKAYPLAVSNLATACINFAAQNGLRQIDADVVRTTRVA